MKGHYMNKNKGFTLIELLVVLAIIGAILAAFLIGRDDTRCIGGYVFTNKSKPVQIMDEQGHGIRCDA